MSRVGEVVLYEAQNCSNLFHAPVFLPRNSFIHTPVLSHRTTTFDHAITLQYSQVEIVISQSYIWMLGLSFESPGMNLSLWKSRTPALGQEAASEETVAKKGKKHSSYDPCTNLGVTLLFVSLSSPCMIIFKCGHCSPMDWHSRPTNSTLRQKNQVPCYNRAAWTSPVAMLTSHITERAHERFFCVNIFNTIGCAGKSPEKAGGRDDEWSQKGRNLGDL